MISFDFINGISVGVEYVPKNEEFNTTIIIDVVIFRIIYQWV